MTPRPFRMPPARLWPHLAPELIRLGLMNLKLRWWCWLSGTTVAEVRRQIRLDKPMGRPVGEAQP